ncbi:hypothetical protein EVAR_77007_1 [Eumeta japonica]|uniref:Reverse transcriptase domain-containing protein n=1 Tax=Eumeta variegata TaxID=151549 RepID=A0A4C1SF75_EUMVA|nr:hypothetical protein EVAR_77007_1 [Eumeta japonica]
MSCLSNASDDQVNLVPSACGLQMVNKMNDTVKNRGMEVNANKTKAMAFERSESKTDCDIYTDGERVEHVEEFVYSSSLFAKDDRDIENSENAELNELAHVDSCE